MRSPLYAMLLKTRAAKLHGSTRNGAQSYTVRGIPLMERCFEEDLVRRHQIRRRELRAKHLQICQA